MRKLILTTTLAILTILLVSIIYLSIYGIKTDNFNTFINQKVKNYNSNLNLKLGDVFIKLNLTQASLNINTENAILLADNNSLKILNIDINLNALKFIKKENSIKNIKIETSENSIKDMTSLLNAIDYDLSRFIFYNRIKNGLIKFKLDTEFDPIEEKINFYTISGNIEDAKFNLVGNSSLDNINFNFEAKDKLTRISNLNFRYQDLNFLSKIIQIKKEEPGEYLINGDIENNKALINPNIIFKLINIKQDFLSKEDIQLKSKNLFSFNLKKYKLKNLKVDSVINFDEVYFSNKYQNLIFLKEGTIKSNYENNQFNADLVSNFVFSDNSKLNDDYKNNNLEINLKGKKNQNIKINGNIRNKKTYVDSKIILNLIKFDPNLLSEGNVNIETDNNFTFEVQNSELKNYFINSTINLDKLELNKKIQDILYFRNIKTKLTFGDKLLKLDLKSNYSLLDENNGESDSNTIYLKLNKSDPKISDVEILLKGKNNKINTKKLNKYFNFQEDFVRDQNIKLDTNSSINFSIDDKFNIKNLAIRSDLNLESLNINYKSNLIKKYFENYENKLVIKKPKILLDYSNENINLKLDGKYSLKNQTDNFSVKFKGNKYKFELYSSVALDNCTLNISDINYFKKNSVPSKLEILIKKSKNNLNFEKMNFTENKNFVLFKNLNISNDFKIKSVDEIDVNFLNKKQILNNFKIKKNSNNYDFIGHQFDGEELLETLLKSNKKNKFSRLFDNINTSVILNLKKIYLEKNSYLEKFVGEFDIKNNKLFLAKVDAILENKKKFSYSYRTTINNEKITNIFIQEPKPFINNYKFIKGFEEGELKLNSIKIENNSRSNLKINNFKVKEVPVLAKILTLASLQGIADLLTGEGIRFDEFEMDFKSKNNLTEIDEMYAIGPAISIMMEGYIEKDRITSLKGTLVPATTINKSIAKIPLLGNILVGSKTGEGVFGVSFKIKGPPDGLKSTVNPIKTLTPRFITRTLEKIKGD